MPQRAFLAGAKAEREAVLEITTELRAKAQTGLADDLQGLAGAQAGFDVLECRIQERKEQGE